MLGDIVEEVQAEAGRTLIDYLAVNDNNDFFSDDDGEEEWLKGSSGQDDIAIGIGTTTTAALDRAIF